MQNTKCAKNSTSFFESKSVPKNQQNVKLHVINNYICKLWEAFPVFLSIPGRNRARFLGLLVAPRQFLTAPGSSWAGPRGQSRQAGVDETPS